MRPRPRVHRKRIGAAVSYAVRMPPGRKASRFPMPGGPCMPRMKSPRLLDHEISAALDRDAREVPGASEVIFAIGAVLAAHLAVALAICVAVGAL